jgi:Spx/MgsR family transcriptional regulator
MSIRWCRDTEEIGMATAKTAKKGTARKRAGVRKKGKTAKFYHKPNCTTCRKARSFMENHGFQLYFRDLGKDKMSSSEIEKLIGRHDYTEFLNSRNELFRKKKMAIRPPSKRDAIRMMAKEPNLIRRPVVVAGGRVVVGFDKDGLAHL